MAWKARTWTALRLARRHWAWTVAVVVACGVLLTVGRAFWSMRSPEHRFTVAFDKIALPTPPPYVPESIRDEVRERGAFATTLDLRDATLPERLQLAFAAHPWVEGVERVRTASSAGIVVELTYRTPVAWVVGPYRETGDPSFLVDGMGRALPALPDVRAASPQLRITGVRDKPRGKPGEPWGIPAVEKAARVATVLGEECASLQIVEIKLDADPLVPDVRLVTSGGTQVAWTLQEDGRMEPTDEQKLKWLKTYVIETGGLDKPAGPYVLDVRRVDGMTRRPLKPS